VSNEEEEQAMGTMRRLIVWSLLAATMAFAVAACGSDDNSSSSSSSTPASSTSAAAPAQPGKGKPPVTIGTKDFTEEFILGELYKGALEAKGYTVKLKKNIGATEIIDTALTSHKIDAYPEYTGESVATVAKRNEPAKTADEEYQLAKDFYEGRGQTVSEATPFEDVDAIATTKAFATKNNLATMEDLKKIGSFSLGARPEFKARQQGLAGMQKVYGINNAKFRQLALGVQYQALDTGKVDAANIFTTDAQLASGKYTVLKDPKGVFGFQNVSFVIDKDKLAALGGDQFMATINSVNKLLTTDAITAMNKAVAIDKQDEATVAKQFLTANKLV
jgi:osmoprotectant transport system substrate-binding protein